MQIPSLVLTVIALAILGAGLAYSGDLLGRRMGKKRLRLGKLRPKHTAIAFTVAMGAAIPIITTFAIMLVSKPVRDWVTEGPQIVEARNALQAELANQKRELTQIAAEKQRIESTLEDQKQQLLSLEQKTNQAEKVRIELMSKIDELSQRERQLQAKVRTAEQRVAKADAEFTELQSKHDRLRSDYKATFDELQDQLQQSQRMAVELNELERKLKAANAEAEAAQNRLVALETEIDEQEQESRKLERRNEELAQEIHVKQQDLNRLQVALSGLVSSAIVYRESPVLVSRGEELARTVVNGGVPNAFARMQLERLIDAASTEAKELGVQPNEQGRAATVQDRHRQVGENTFITITSEDLMSAWTDAISRADGEVVVVATSFYNFFTADAAMGRTVPLDVVMYRNRLVYQKGQEIATLQIAGGRSESETLATITDFVREELSRIAAADGVVPTLGGTVPVELPGVKQLAKVVDAIQKSRGTVTLVIYAPEDVKSGAPVAIDFKIRQ